MLRLRRTCLRKYPQMIKTTMDIEAEAQKIIGRARLAVSGEGGHNTTFAVACKLARLTEDEDTLMRWMGSYNERLDDKWTDWELYHKATDAIAKQPPKAPSRARPPMIPKGKVTPWKPAGSSRPAPKPADDEEPASKKASRRPPDPSEGEDPWRIEDIFTPPSTPAGAYVGFF